MQNIDAAIIFTLTITSILFAKMIIKILSVDKNDGIYKHIYMYLICIIILLSGLPVLGLEKIGDMGNLNKTSNNLLWAILLGAYWVVMFCFITYKYIAESKKGDEAKAYKMAAAWLDFIYVALGFIGVITALAQLTSSTFQNLRDTDFRHSSEIMKERIENNCFNVNTKELKNIDSRINKQNNLYINVHATDDIFDNISACKVRPFTIKHDEIDQNYDGSTFLKKLLWAAILLISFSGRFTKSIFDLYFNRYRRKTTN